MSENKERKCIGKGCEATLVKADENNIIPLCNSCRMKYISVFKNTLKGMAGFAAIGACLYGWAQNNSESLDDTEESSDENFEDTELF